MDLLLWDKFSPHQTFSLLRWWRLGHFVSVEKKLKDLKTDKWGYQVSPRCSGSQSAELSVVHTHMLGFENVVLAGQVSLCLKLRVSGPSNWPQGLLSSARDWRRKGAIIYLVITSMRRACFKTFAFLEKLYHHRNSILFKIFFSSLSPHPHSHFTKSDPWVVYWEDFSLNIK